MLSIASAQMKPADGDVIYNIREHIKLIELAAENGADLVVFPEMSLTGYVRETAKALCFTQDDARLCVLRDLAADKNMIIIAGAPVVIDSALYIGSFIMFPDRSIRVYTKQFLHTGEEEFFSSSFDYNPVIELGGERICLAICADIDNPLHAASAGENHCTIYIASIFFRNAATAHDALQGYAKKHSMNVLMSNYCGATYGLEAGGRSAMWSRNGNIIAELNKADTGLVIGKKSDGVWHGSVVRSSDTAGTDSMEIRELEEYDIRQAMELVWEVFSEFEAPGYSRQGIDEFHKFIAAEAIIEKMRSGELKLWGCFDSGRIVGTAAAKSFDPEPYKEGQWSGSHISLLFVKKEYHRQGIARRLYEEAKRACRGARVITVNSSPYAVEIYKRLGFVPVDDEKTVNGIRFTPMKHIL